MFPTSLRNPLYLFSTTSGIPPVFVATIGTLHAMASRAARPKLSFEEGRRNKSEILRTSLVDFKFPRK